MATRSQFKRRMPRSSRPGQWRVEGVLVRLRTIVGLVLLVGATAGCGEDTTLSNRAEVTPARVASVPVAAPDGLEIPVGMVYVPGGQTLIGAEAALPGLAHERPAFEAEVVPFFLDQSPVTVARFRSFVEATGYETQAEGFGDAGVLDRETGAWTLAAGANWQRPLGPDAPPAPEDHPVTQVSWNDAQAHCAWTGGRLPTEAEWEHAARGARNRAGPYPWGGADAQEATEEPDEHRIRYRANTWNGTFPVRNTGADGYLRTSPVAAFGATELGLTDLAGNVWEWTASWYQPYPLHADVAQPPTGPSGEPERVQRGGSYLCNPSWCHGYRVSARSHATPETALEHVGFRCARDLPASF